METWTCWEQIRANIVPLRVWEDFLKPLFVDRVQVSRSLANCGTNCNIYMILDIILGSDEALFCFFGLLCSGSSRGLFDTSYTYPFSFFACCCHNFFFVLYGFFECDPQVLFASVFCANNDRGNCQTDSKANVYQQRSCLVTPMGSSYSILLKYAFTFIANNVIFVWADKFQWYQLNLQALIQYQLETTAELMKRTISKAMMELTSDMNDR